ncbi:Aste57867_14588 [Aphanomyces stellatus]|uniref:Aste57867_14588 protein n=1 Tax=Aphanomyces stellatus TaxID=120398 RepID=A0A485L3P7_9STRA|nr:hypothetical protein As57867_014534 [Aphanomyces stellatus]VFT91407.1 Aste57867_14588 [Aphanomyces stellatus]
MGNTPSVSAAGCLKEASSEPIHANVISLSDNDLLVLVLENVLSAQECRALIATSEASGFSQALLNVGGGREVLCTEIRNSDRCMLDDAAAAAIIWGRIRSFLPATFNGHEVVGVNERLRFLRYDPGQEFKPHVDGSYCRPDKTEMSFLTIQLYLNGGQGLVGGATTIFDKNGDVDIQPAVGRALIFQHRGVCHAGGPVVHGRKYTIRSDIMCRLPPDFNFGRR